MVVEGDTAAPDGRGVNGPLKSGAEERTTVAPSTGWPKESTTTPPDSGAVTGGRSAAVVAGPWLVAVDWLAATVVEPFPHAVGATRAITAESRTAAFLGHEWSTASSSAARRPG